MKSWYILIMFFIALTNSMANADESEGNPKAVFWFDSHPGMPLIEEWQEGDTAKGLDEEFWYRNMASRLGSPNHFFKIKSLGFDAIASEFPECVLHVYGMGCGSPTREDWFDSSVYFLAGLSGGQYTEVADIYENLTNSLLLKEEKKH